MAAPRERSYDNPYEDGGGGYGKFRKRPFRRSAATPYDRHPPAVTVGALPGSGGRGWLSKLVDPAQRIITSGAHRLFASVFRKRLTQAPPSFTEEVDRESKQPETGNHSNPTETPPCVSQDMKGIGSGTTSFCNEGDGILELEQALKQQTFTKSEIDRLTSLLQSRLADQPSENLLQKPELPPPAFNRDSKDCRFETPVKEIERNSLVKSSSNAARNNDIQEEMTSPTELAKAYMGGRPSMGFLKSISPSSMAVVDNPNAVVNSTMSPPSMAVVPRSVDVDTYRRNGLVTPRSVGRSALYGMVRTPYSRGLQFNPIQEGWNNKPIESRQGPLKRRSSVLDSDIGTVGPIRRIRQKSNLLPASGILAGRGNGFASNTSQLKLTKDKAVLSGEPLENGDHKSESPGFSPVPSKSSEMATKILQQLDTLVSSREKMPLKLSPSMLRGPALRSLDNVESSKTFTSNVDVNQVPDRVANLWPVHESKPHNNSSTENGGTKTVVSNNKSVPSVSNGAADGTKISTVGLASTSQSETLPSKRRGFQMSANEDCFEFDDGDHANGSSSIFTVVKENSSDAGLRSTINGSHNFTDKKKAAVEIQAAPKSDLRLSSVVTPKESSYGSFCGSDSPVALKHVPIEKTFSEASAKLYQQKDPIFELNGSQLQSQPHFGLSSLTQENSTSIGAFGRTTEPLKESVEGNSDRKDSKEFIAKTAEITAAVSSAPSSIFSFGGSANISGSSNSSVVSSSCFSGSASDSVTTTLSNAISSASTLPISSSTAPLFKFGGFSTSSAPSSESALVASEVKESKDNGMTSSYLSNSFIGASARSGMESNLFTGMASHSNSESELFSGTKSITTSSGLLTNLPSAATASSGLLTNMPSAATASSGLLTNMPSAATASSGLFSVTSSAVTPSPFGNTFSATTVSSVLLGGTLSASTTSPGLFSGAPSSTTFTGLFTATSSAVDFSSTSAIVPSSSGSMPADSTSGSATFSFGSGATSSSSSNQFVGLNPFTASSRQSASSTESSTFKFGPTASATSFAPAENTGFSFGNSHVTSSTSDKVFGTGSTFGLTSSAASAASSSSGTSPVFGSNWQSPKSSFFGSSSNSSSGIVFGSTANSNDTAAAAETPAVGFNVSTASAFNFSSPATTLPNVFGNPNSSTAAATPAPEHNSMEDSMAEDTVVQATNPPTVFGQQLPSSGFAFGSGTPSAVNQFGSTLTAPSPSPFGTLPSMPIQQTPSPFQASGSLEFQAGGSFSLGTSGGDKANRRIVKVKKPLRKR